VGFLPFAGTRSDDKVAPIPDLPAFTRTGRFDRELSLAVLDPNRQGVRSPAIPSDIPRRSAVLKGSPRGVAKAGWPRLFIVFRTTYTPLATRGMPEASRDRLYSVLLVVLIAVSHGDAISSVGEYDCKPGHPGSGVLLT